MNRGERRNGGDRRRLTGPQRAAALLIVLGKGAAPKLLQHLDKDEVRQIAGAAATLGIVDRMSLDRMIDEFASQLADGPEIVGTLTEAQQLVSGSLAPQEVVQLVEGDRANVPIDVWRQLEGLSDDSVSVILSKEPPHISALVLKKLEPDRVAVVLDRMEPARRPEIVAQMLLSTPATPAAANLFETSIRAVLEAGEKSANDGPSPQHVADIVNRLDDASVDDVVSYLSAIAPERAAAVKALVFKFDELTRLSQPDRVALFDGLATERVILALKGASADVVESALSSLGARARRMVESELLNDGPAPQAEVQAARRIIVQAALRLSAAGTIVLPGSKVAE